MKKTHIFIAIAMLAAASSCRRDNNGPGIGANCALEVSPLFDEMKSPEKPNQSRASADADAFKAGDKVGLFMVNFTAETTHGTLNGADGSKNQAHNREFIANASGLLVAQPPVFYTKDFEWNVDIFAYYPYAESWDTQADIAKYPFAVLTDQSDATKIAASDLCYAKTDAAGHIPSAAAVPLRFNHKLSKIQVTICLPAALHGNRTIEAIENMKFNDVSSSVTLNMTSGATATVTAPKVEITPLQTRKMMPVNGLMENTYEVIVPVQNFGTASNLFSFALKFATGGGENQKFAYKLPANVFDGKSTTTTAGMLHKIKLTLDLSGEIVLTGSDIIEWKTGTTHTSDLTNQITTQFSIKVTGITSPESINRVKITTDENATVYDIKASEVTGAVTTTTDGLCSFRFTEKSGSPYDYGFTITKIEFMAGEVSKGVLNFNSARVYSPTTMDLGTKAI